MGRTLTTVALVGGGEEEAKLPQRPSRIRPLGAGHLSSSTPIRSNSTLTHSGWMPGGMFMARRQAQSLHPHSLSD